jgi:hypothetical protein
LIVFLTCVVCNRRLTPFHSSGSNGYRSFAGFKDDHSTSAPINYHSCEKLYYYI